MSYADKLRDLGMDIPLGRTGQLKVKCPKCGKGRHKDVSVNIDKGLYQCWKSSCDFMGTVAGQTFKRPADDYKPLTGIARHLKYLIEERGISEKTLEKMKVGVNKNNHIRFNYYRGDELINFKDRIVVDDKKTFRQQPEAEHILYNVDSLEGKKVGIMVEGEIDVLTLVDIGLEEDYGIVSIDQGAGKIGADMGKRLECISRCYRQVNAIQEWIICTDGDPAGEWLAKCLIDRLGDHRCKKVTYPKGRVDVNEMLTVKNIDRDANIQSITDMIKNAKWVKAKGIIELDEDQTNVMLQYYDEGLPTGKKLGWPCLQGQFSFLAGDMTLIHGIPSHGKGTWVRQMALDQSNRYKAKWAVFAPEDMPPYLFYEDLCHAYIGKTTMKDKPGRATKSEFITAMDFVREYFYLIYPESDDNGKMPIPNNEWINEKIYSLKVKHGVNGFIKDPWNQIYHSYSGREDEYLSEELSKEKLYCSSFDYSIYVAHPRTQKRMPKDEKWPAPTPYDLSGGSMWYNKIDNIGCVHRPNNDDDDDKAVDIIWQKIKKKKLVGRGGSSTLMYDWKSNRYFDITKDPNNGYNPLPGLGNEVSYEVNPVFTGADFDVVAGDDMGFPGAGNINKIAPGGPTMTSDDEIDDPPF